MPLELSGRRLWALIAIGAVLVISIPVAFLFGRSTAPQVPPPTSTSAATQSPATTSRSGTTSGTPSSSSTSTQTPPATGSTSASSSGPPSSPTTTGSTGASVSGRPGDSVLAAAGTGPSTARFTPSGDTWTLRATFDCVAGSAFTLVVTKQDGSTAASVSGSGRGEDTRTINATGPFSLTIGGQCRWTVSASG